MTGLVPVAVGVLRDPAGRLLLCSRPFGKVYAGWWELPGGKLEAGETAEAALLRELSEELSLTTSATVQRLWQDEFVYDHAHVQLVFCQLQLDAAGAASLTPREGQQMRWVSWPQDLSRASALPYPVLPGTWPALQRLSKMV